MQSQQQKMIEGWPSARVDAMQAKVFDWARDWVQNETCIDETPLACLDQDERDALQLMGVLGVIDLR